MPDSDNNLKDLPRRLFKMFTSYGLVVVVLVFLLVLTLFGTLEQTERGIYDVVEAYFNSAFVVHDLGGVPLPLPGGYLLMVLLFLNLLCGAIIKARKEWRFPGMLIAHGGILLLLLGGMVSTHWSKRGYMQLFESETSNEFYSFIDWQLEISEVGEDNKLEEALIVPARDLADINLDEQRVFVSDELPFDVVVNGYARNARPLPAASIEKGALKSREIDGFVLEPVEIQKEAERNIAGMYLEFREKESGEKHEAIMWGGENFPHTLTIDDKKWAVRFTKAKWQVPFEIRLDEFTAVYHAGSDIPARFESYITKIENGTEEKVKIWMNHPLRHEGYTFFQRSFGSEDENDPLAGHQYSVFDVVENPADQWPLYSLIVVGVGLLIHFLQKLGSHLKTARSNRLAAASS